MLKINKRFINTLFHYIPI